MEPSIENSPISYLFNGTLYGCHHDPYFLFLLLKIEPPQHPSIQKASTRITMTIVQSIKLFQD
ncbi:MAG: hypothetical protein JSR76_02625 [Verrucomicrobia bacterium]|nr:hypothetical protein [Verrucomicrobiota bacterium]